MLVPIPGIEPGTVLAHELFMNMYTHTSVLLCR